MSRPFLCACACTIAMLTTGPAYAQAFGARAGLTFASVSIDPSDALGLEVTGQAGLLAGGFVTFGADARFGVEVDGVVALRRVAFGDDIEDKLTYLELPAVARFAVLRRESLAVHALGGASFGYLLRALESVQGADPFDIKDAMETFEVAAVAGAQVSWNGRWIFDGRYVFGLTDVYQEPPDDVRFRQRGFQITVGYRFR